MLSLQEILLVGKTMKVWLPKNLQEQHAAVVPEQADRSEEHVHVSCIQVDRGYCILYLIAGKRKGKECGTGAGSTGEVVSHLRKEKGAVAVRRGQSVR